MSQVGLGGILLTLTGSPTFTDITIYGLSTVPNTISAAIGPIQNARKTLIHDFQHPVGGAALPEGFNIWIGGAGNFTTGATAAFNYHSSRNIGIGPEALEANGTGFWNIAIGYRAAKAMVSGSTNLAIGPEALLTNVDGYENVCIGKGTMEGVHAGGGGYENTAVGVEALGWTSGGCGNVGLGHRAGEAITDGLHGIYIGWGAGWGAEDAVGTANKPLDDIEGILIGFLADRSVVSATVLTGYCGIGARVLIDKSLQFKLGPAFTEINLGLAALPIAANDAAAAIAGILVGGLYRTNADPSIVCIRSA